MLVFDKLKIREALTTENIFDLLQEFGGDPGRESFGLTSATICHNPPGEGSRKLYYYENTGLFKCFTGCDEYFDPFQLVIKIARIQWDKEFDLNDYLIQMRQVKKMGSFSSILKIFVSLFFIITLSLKKANQRNCNCFRLSPASQAKP